MASTTASNLTLMILLLAHSISDPRRSHAAKRLNLGLSKLFKVGNPDDLKSMKAFLTPKDSLHAAWESFEPEMVRSSSKNGKKRFEAVLEARVIFSCQIFFSE